MFKSLKNRLRFHKKRIWVDASANVSKKAVLDTHTYGNGSIRIGANSRIFEFAVLSCCGGAIQIGENSTVNPFCVLYGHGGLQIGNGVRIAAQTVMIPANHKFVSTDRPIYQQGLTKKGIVIEDDVWIGAGCKILDGVTIGKGSVIGAGSVVTKSVAPYSVMVGVPAKPLYNRKDRCETTAGSEDTICGSHGSNTSI